MLITAAYHLGKRNKNKGNGRRECEPTFSPIIQEITKPKNHSL